MVTVWLETIARKQVNKIINFFLFDQILKGDHSNERTEQYFFKGAAFYGTQCGSNFSLVKGDQLN